MPIYEFKCESCGQVFEVRRSFGEASGDATCPHDGKLGTKLFSAPMLNMPGRASGGPPVPLSDTGFSGSGDGHGGHGHSHGPGSHTH